MMIDIAATGTNQYDLGAPCDLGAPYVLCEQLGPTGGRVRDGCSQGGRPGMSWSTSTRRCAQRAGGAGQERAALVRRAGQQTFGPEPSGEVRPS